MRLFLNHLLLFFNQALVSPLLDGLMAAVTIAAMPLLAALSCLLLPTRKRREGLALLAVLALSALAAVGLQFLLMRPRPVGVRLVLPMPTFPSFPSGHAAGAFGWATFVALACRRGRFAALLGAAIISFSRLYVGHHYPTDLLGGAIVGAATAAVVYGVFFRSGGEGRPRWAWLLWGQVAAVLLASLCAYLGLLNLNYLALPGADKALHFLFLGGLAFLSVGWWAQQPLRVVLVPLGLLTSVEEALQSLSPLRSPDPLDLAAGLAGVALFGWLGTVARRRGRGTPRGASAPFK